LAPKYEKAAQTVHIPLAKVNVRVEKKLAERFKIIGVPLLRLWLEGQESPITYDDDRDLQSFFS
jgi:thioredoxin-like negative regulator of GroEL